MVSINKNSKLLLEYSKKNMIKFGLIPYSYIPLRYMCIKSKSNCLRDKSKPNSEK